MLRSIANRIGRHFCWNNCIRNSGSLIATPGCMQTYKNKNKRRNFSTAQIQKRIGNQYCNFNVHNLFSICPCKTCLFVAISTVCFSFFCLLQCLFRFSILLIKPFDLSLFLPIESIFMQMLKIEL